MAIDKNKIIEAATKYVQRGQLDKAIREYARLLELDPKDVRIQQKLGELYQKKGDKQRAAACFLKVAETYAADGFFLKAVAVFKQVLKVLPGMVEVNLRLAELHQQLGLVGDAMAQYQIVVAHYEKQGDTRASLDTLHKLVELDPDNVPSRVKLAELYARESMIDKAVAELEHAAAYLRRQNRLDDYARVAERWAYLAPENLELSRELARIYLSRNDPKRALTRLQHCFKATPRDPELLQMLGQTFVELGDVPKAVAVYKELARLYAEQGKASEEQALWRRILEIAPEDAEARERQAAARPPTLPAAAPAAPAPPRSEPSLKSPAEQIAKLLTETDVYVKYGLHEKALEHLRKVFALDPDSLEAHEKSVALFTATGNHTAASDALARAARLCIARGELARARERVRDLADRSPDHPELAELQSLCGSAEEAELIPELDGEVLIEAVTDHPVQPPAAPDFFPADPTPAELTGPVDEPFLGAGQGEDEQLFEEPRVRPSSSGLPAPGPVPELALKPAAERGTADEDDLALSQVADPSDDLIVDDPEIETPGRLAPPDSTLEIMSVSAEVDLDAIHAFQRETGALSEPESGGWAPEGIAGDEEDALALVAAQAEALEEPPETSWESDPELGSGAFEAPLADLPALGEGAGGSDSGAPRRASTQPGLGAPGRTESGIRPSLADRSPVSVHDELAAERPVGLSPTSPEAETPAYAGAFAGEEPAGEPETDEADEAVADELDEAEFFIEQKVADEAREILQTVLLAYPGSRRASALWERLEALERELAQAQGRSVPEFVDLAAELAADASALEAPRDFQYSVEDVFNEFKKGVQQIVKAEDVETHYDLGIAYKEMGLLEDAVGEFEQALSAAAGTPKEVECLTMLGLCWVESERYDEGIDAFQRALQAEALTPEAAKALHYELGLAFERKGNCEEALRHLEAVREADPSYRDVRKAIGRIQRKAG